MMAINRELNFAGSSPLLYLVATPIGNLGEFSARAKEIISSMDYVACEDTRNTGKLLSLFSISKPLISCHEHNEEQSGDKIINLLLEGKKIAYVSDAGYPCISDPGERLVKKCLQNGIKISVINGSNALLCALAASGLDTNHFYFHGFLNSKQSERIKELEENKSRKETMIFYESPHRIGKTLSDMYSILGDRKICIGRELTKNHEEFIRCTLHEAKSIEESTLIGEMVLVVEGNEEDDIEIDDNLIENELKSALKTMNGKEAIKFVTDKLNIKKNSVYDVYLNIKSR